MRREERVTVQGPVKEQQPDGMSHTGYESTTPHLTTPLLTVILAPIKRPPGKTNHHSEASGVCWQQSPRITGLVLATFCTCKRSRVLWAVCYGRPQGTTYRQPPTATNRQPPMATNRYPRIATNHQPPPTANHQPPPTANRQPPPTANRQWPLTANRQSPPTMVEHMSYTWSFCKTAVQEHFFFPLLRTPLGGAGVLCIPLGTLQGASHVSLRNLR